MKLKKRNSFLRIGQKLTWCVGYSNLTNAISMWCGVSGTRLWKRDKKMRQRESKMENPHRYVKPPGSIAWRREDKNEGD